MKIFEISFRFILVVRRENNSTKVMVGKEKFIAFICTPQPAINLYRYKISYTKILDFK